MGSTIAWLPGSHTLAFFARGARQQLEPGAWNVVSGQQVRLYQVNSQHPLAASPDRQAFACVREDSVVLIDAASWEPLYLYHGKGAASALAWSPGGRYLASGGGGRMTLDPIEPRSAARESWHGHHPGGLSAPARTPATPLQADRLEVPLPVTFVRQQRYMDG